MSKYRAILFDLDGVLILDKPGYKSSELEHKVFKRLGLSLDDKNEKEKIKKELGWNEDQFWKFVDNSWQGAIPNSGLINLIKKLKKKGYKTAIISNTSGSIMRRRLKNFFRENIDTVFDQVIISSEVGLLKPDKRIFELTLNRLNVFPNESVFIDDAKEYLKGARALGIITLLFTTNEKAKRDLVKLGLID